MTYKGRGQFFDRALYLPPPVPFALEAAPQPAWDIIPFSWSQWTLVAENERIIRERGTPRPRARRYMDAFFQHLLPSSIDAMNFDRAIGRFPSDHVS